MKNPLTIRQIPAILLVPILLVGGFAPNARGRGRIASVQSISIAPYQEAIDGFADICTLSMDRILISDKQPVPITERIRRLEPELILAVGLDALNALTDISDIPIVFVMLLCPECQFMERPNITGVNMAPAIDVQLGKINDLLPDVRNIGLVFNPEKTGAFIQNASEVAGSLGIDILAVPVASDREVPTRLAGIRDHVQMIWMIPDVSVITYQTVEFFLLFSMEKKIPLIAFSEKYVDMGAFMAFGIDPKDMGRQAGEMANMILSGTSPDSVPVQDARKISVTVNRRLAKKFGVALNETLLETVKFVE